MTDLKKILFESLKSSSTLYAWEIRSEQILFCELNLKKIESQRIIISVPDHSMPTLERLIGGLGKLQLYSESVGAVFVCDVQKFDEMDSLELSLSKEVYQVDRREAPRYQFKNLIQLRCTYQDGSSQNHFCYDLSETGCSIILSQSQKKHPYKQGDVCKLLFGRDDLVVEAEVVELKKLAPFHLERVPYAYAKVSFRFRELPAAIARAIKDFMEHLQ